MLTAGFRFFFLSAGLFAVLSMTLWLIWLGIHATGGMVQSPTIAVAPYMWHAHEMIFGYAVAVTAGFFLTAVPSWTNTAPARIAFVSSVGGLWLAGRIVVWFAAYLPATVVAVVDLMFLPILAVRLAHQMRNNPQPRNLVVVGLLALVTIANVLIHLEWIGWTDDTAGAGLRLGLFTIAGLITIIGGRVVPAFTRNALLRRNPEAPLPMSNPLFERVGIAAALTFAVAMPFGLPSWLLGLVAAIAGLANAARLIGWQWRQTLAEPILWSLHLAFAMLSVGYLAVAAAYIFGVPHEVAALHIIGIGAIGGMTLAMMTRASLGHTGRPLAVTPPITVGYLLIAIAALVRAFGSEFLPSAYYEVVFLSGALWISGFALFTVVYWPILTRPRPARGEAA
ncbi:MAG: NnrS family protein [Hyphomicrobiales bacterium]|nr:NnrS family protein [Hyphomicrobiales bacterium]